MTTLGAKGNRKTVSTKEWARSRTYLTRREHQILYLFANGHGGKDIARQFNIRLATVYQHLRHIKLALGVKTVYQAVAMWAATHPKSVTTSPEVDRRGPAYTGESVDDL